MRSMLILIAFLVAHGAAAQSSSSTPSSIGVWRGTSLCLVKPSSCKDEVVVYRIARMSASDSVSFDARKVVSGEELEMGVLSCRVAANGANLTCVIPRGKWNFTIRGDSLTGELRLPDGTKFRDVRTTRSR